MTDIDKALELARAVTKLAAGFPGHFFHDPECTDLVYIATDCEKQQCDCSVGEDCAVIVGACDGIDDVAEPLAQLLNAAGPLARALLALHTRVEAMAAVVAAAEVWRDEMERIALLAVDHESKNMSRRVAHDLLYEAITFNGPTGGAK